nr:homoserine O-acetyltransferase [Brevibacillus fulvus]
MGDLPLDSGEVLTDVAIAYHTYGTYDRSKGNAVLVCHALTGDSNAAGGGDQPGWWGELIGPGKVIDTNRYYVICSNVLGGCYGSTGPASLNPRTGKPYATSFPLVTIRDMVRAQRKLLDSLGVERLYAVIGGSMGGMQVYEWAVEYPEMSELVIPIATCTQTTAMAIAYNDVARQAICSDAEWQNGHYYPAAGPSRGLAIARMLGMITYRSTELFEQRFGRHLCQQEPNHLYQTCYQVESYLRYQGEKLVSRFDANSYLYLLKAIDTHDIGRGRGGVEQALAKIRARLVAIGITNDLLYPPDGQKATVDMLARQGHDSSFYLVESIYGHDGFLIEFEKIGEILRPFFAKIAVR